MMDVAVRKVATLVTSRFGYTTQVWHVATRSRPTTSLIQAVNR